MGEVLLWRKLSLTKVLAEIVTAIAPETETVTVGVMVIVTVIMEVVVVDLVVESASSVASQVILPGNVPVKVAEGADMAAGMIGMAVVAEGVMVLIGMEIGLGDGTGILVVMGEVNDTIVTVLAHMTGANDSFKLCGMQHSPSTANLLILEVVVVLMDQCLCFAAEELEDPRLLDANIGRFFSQMFTS